MTIQKFAVGQIVEFGRSGPPHLRPSGPYEVVSVLPGDEANSFTYRVKSTAESFARAAREFDLVAVGGPQQPAETGPDPQPLFRPPRSR
jgi:hypothetical protein